MVMSVKEDKNIYNYHELKREIIYKYGSLKRFASEVLHISPIYFSRILSSKAEYSQKYIDLTIEALELDHVQVGSYFFTHEFRKVPKGK